MEQGNIIRDFGTNYISIPSDVLQDVNISCKARGLYATIMGLPRYWTLTVRGLLPIIKEGEKAIYSALKELEEYGYVTRSQDKLENGKFGGVVYTLHAHSTRKADKESNVLQTEKQFSSHYSESIKEKEEKKLLSIDDRAKIFYNTLVQYINNPYTENMIESFFDYWSEPNPSHKKMRFELQKTWDVKRRLRTWNKNDFKYGGKYNSNNRTMQMENEKERRASEARSTIISMLSEGNKPENVI